MHRVCADVNGSSWPDKIVRSDPELRREVPNARVGAGTVIRKVEVTERRTDGDGPGRRKRLAEGRILVVRPDKTAGSLHPRHPPLTVREVPAKDRWRHADSGERAADRVLGGARDVGSGRHRSGKDLRALRALKFRCVALPQWKDFNAVLEVALEETLAEIRRQDAAGMSTDEEELEAAAILGETEAALHQRAEVPRSASHGLNRLASEPRIGSRRPSRGLTR